MLELLKLANKLFDGDSVPTIPSVPTPSMGSTDARKNERSRVKASPENDRSRTQSDRPAENDRPEKPVRVRRRVPNRTQRQVRSLDERTAPTRVYTGTGELHDKILGLVQKHGVITQPLLVQILGIARGDAGYHIDNLVLSGEIKKGQAKFPDGHHRNILSTSYAKMDEFLADPKAKARGSLLDESGALSVRRRVRNTDAPPSRS
jgi:hypothetical protein